MLQLAARAATSASDTLRSVFKLLLRERARKDSKRFRECHGEAEDAAKLVVAARVAQALNPAPTVLRLRSCSRVVAPAGVDVGVASTRRVQGPAGVMHPLTGRLWLTCGC